jgi:hypothetical protein
MEQIKQIIESHFIRDDLVRILFNLNIENIYTSKFKCLQSMLSNIFLNDSTKEEIMSTLCNIQRFIHAIFRLKRIWKLKKANTYNTEDLYMNPIHMGQKNTITLLQNNTKYIFQIRELIGSINNALSNCCHFFIEPLICKNPYTNIPFDKASLYNIYFAVRASTFIMPPLLHQYFLADFHLSDFAITNQHSMNQEYLRTYVNNNCVQDVVDIVKDMFDDHKMIMKINKGFPKDQLFSIMKPYLHLYFISNYSLNEFKKRLHFKILHRKLHEFVRFNPTFGRKKVRLTQVNPFSKSKKIEYYFDENHIEFNDPIDCEDSSKYFMKSHLCKKEFYNRNLFSAPSLNRSNRLNSHFIIVNESAHHYSERYSQDEDDDYDENHDENEQQDDDGNSEREYPQYNSVQQEYQQYNLESESDSDTLILEDSDIES